MKKLKLLQIPVSNIFCDARPNIAAEFNIPVTGLVRSKVSPVWSVIWENLSEYTK